MDIFVQPRKKHLKLEKICSFFFNEKTINSPQSDNLLSCKVFYPDIILNLIHIALLHENAIRGNSGIRIKNRVRNSELFTSISSHDQNKHWNVKTLKLNNQYDADIIILAVQKRQFCNHVSTLCQKVKIFCTDLQPFIISNTYHMPKVKKYHLKCTFSIRSLSRVVVLQNVSIYTMV